MGRKRTCPFRKGNPVCSETKDCEVGVMVKDWRLGMPMLRRPRRRYDQGDDVEWEYRRDKIRALESIATSLSHISVALAKKKEDVDEKG